MKGFKKIAFLILALLPMLAVIVFAVGNIGNTEGLEFLPLGAVSVETVENGVIFACTPNSWAERLIVPLIGSEPVVGFYGAIGRLLLTVESNAGFPISLPVVFAVFYMAYIFILELLSALCDLLLFVPRKVSEVFR